MQSASLETHIIGSQSRPQGVLVGFFNKTYFYVVNLLLVVYGQNQGLTVGVHGGVTNQKGPILAQTEQFRHILVVPFETYGIRRLSATMFTRCKACSASTLLQTPTYHSSLSYGYKYHTALLRCGLQLTGHFIDYLHVPVEVPLWEQSHDLLCFEASHAEGAPLATLIL